ncbi:MAG: cell division protein ZapA [Nitrospirae bacterium]|nr:cell division protein ZapA [Nitrospirota bacterium]
MGSTEVYILGQKYIVKGDATEEHIKKLAAYVNEKLKEVYDSSPNITPVKASILAALNIADELHRLKDEQENLTRHIEEKANTLTALFD